jgi:large subunit ribosomal protein L10
MAKSKELKSEMLIDAQQAIEDASSIVYGEYRGLDVESMTQLRKTSRSVGVKLKIYKNTIFKKALTGSKFELLNGHLEGPLVYGISSDAVAPAKLLVDFSKENEGLIVKGGALDGSILDLNSVMALASIPPRDELIGKLLGVANSPIQGFVRTLNEVPSRLVRVLSAVRDQK